MRPGGPGILVVMALAFISGARRGTTLQLSQPFTNQQQQQQEQGTRLPRSSQYFSSSSSGGGGGGGSSNSNNNNRVAKYSGAEAATGALARINPWLSACDLAQPHSAPDLQGQCSASKLPVAWVEEGPGPPQCPESCESIRSQPNFNKHKINIITLNDKHDDNNIMDNNSSKSINNNKMKERICDETRRQEEEGENGEDVEQSSAATQQQHFSSSSSDIYKQQQQQQRQNALQQQQQQCLDYLGDNEASSPAQICKKSPSDIETKLRYLRLRHCCERNALSALHQAAFLKVLGGGEPCVKLLNDLVESDALATRITCEFTEILVRYDCRQMYSIIHHCEDCKEAYRRWVCSTLIPYFVETNITTPAKGSDKSETKKSVTKRSSEEPEQPKAIDENSLKDVLKRTRRKSKNSTVRRRVRPCLSVCQTVEQKCPYMLPGDRAPAYPTQYAGEPTFLCLDPNIEETGDQLRKSNHGPDNCCYDYCGSPGHGLCSQCVTVEPDEGANATNSTTSLTSTFDASVDDVPDELPQCQTLQVPSTSDISTIRTSVLPNTRCPIPYYVGPRNKLPLFAISTTAQNNAPLPASTTTTTSTTTAPSSSTTPSPSASSSSPVSSFSRNRLPSAQFLIAVSVVVALFLCRHHELFLMLSTGNPVTTTTTTLTTTRTREQRALSRPSTSVGDPTRLPLLLPMDRLLKHRRRRKLELLQQLMVAVLYTLLLAKIRRRRKQNEMEEKAATTRTTTTKCQWLLLPPPRKVTSRALLPTDNNIMWKTTGEFVELLSKYVVGSTNTNNCRIHLINSKFMRSEWAKKRSWPSCTARGSLLGLSGSKNNSCGHQLIRKHERKFKKLFKQLKDVVSRFRNEFSRFGESSNWPPSRYPTLDIG